MVIKMKRIEIIKSIKTKNNDFVVLMKYGNFYRVFGDDGYIVWNLCGFKVINNDHVGFPIISLNRVINCLSENNVSYIVFDNPNEFKKVEMMHNNYLLTLGVSIEKYNYYMRVENILNKIRDELQINSILFEYERKYGIYSNN